MKKIFLFLFLLPFLTHCSHYVAKLQQDLNFLQASKKKKSLTSLSLKKKKVIKKPSPLKSSFKKNYNFPLTKKRYKVKDLNDDHQEDVSLWNGRRGKNQFLFTNSEKKGEGDLILISLSEKLQNEIREELARAFPKNLSPPSRKDSSQDSTHKKEKMKKYISSVIVETIGPAHFRIQGRKKLRYGQKKHQIELQALVAKKNISVDDTIDSDHFIESHIRILK